MGKEEQVNGNDGKEENDKWKVAFHDGVVLCQRILGKNKNENCTAMKTEG